MKILQFLLWLLFPVLIWVLTTDSQAKTPETSAAWAGAPFKVDGKMDDWRDIKGEFFSDEKASIATANDQQYLYVLFKTTDPRTAMTIKMAGLTLYIDPQADKKKDFSLTFKGGPSRAQLRNWPGMERRGNREGRDRDDMQPPDDMQGDRGPGGPGGQGGNQLATLTCNIKDRINDKEIPMDGSEGPSAAFDTSMGFFVYEFAIPLTEVETVRYYGISGLPGKPITIGAVWGDMSKMMQGRGEGQRGGGMGGPGGGGGGRGGDGGFPDFGGGGGRGGGMGGPGGPPGGMGRDMGEKQEAWIKSTLATQPQ